MWYFGHFDWHYFWMQILSESIKHLNVQAQLASAQSCDPSHPTTGVTWPAMVSTITITITIFTIFFTIRSSNDVCKLRIDFETMVLAAPFSVSPIMITMMILKTKNNNFLKMPILKMVFPPQISSTSVLADGIKTGDCVTDTLSVSNPGGNSPPGGDRWWWWWWC